MASNSDYRYLIVRKTGKSLRHSVFQLLADIISDNQLNDIFTINKTDMAVTCVNGSRLIMSGLDDVDKLKSVAGINRVWVEEASEKPNRILTSLICVCVVRIN